MLGENTDAYTLLVFPSYFKRERPKPGETPAPLVTYSFSGMLDEIYATLVVRLRYTTAFEKDQLWRFAADFKTQAGQRVGLKMTRKAEGARRDHRLLRAGRGGRDGRSTSSATSTTT